MIIHFINISVFVQMALLTHVGRCITSSIAMTPQGTANILVLTFLVLCRFAHNQSGGKTLNGRDSNPKYLGVKKYGGYTHFYNFLNCSEHVIPGNIIVRQRGTKYHPGIFNSVVIDE